MTMFAIILVPALDPNRAATGTPIRNRKTSALILCSYAFNQLLNMSIFQSKTFDQLLFTISTDDLPPDSHLRHIFA